MKIYQDSHEVQHRYLPVYHYDLYGLVRNVLMREDPLRGQVGGGWALEIETFLGPVKLHLAVRRVPFGAQKSPPSPPPSRAVNFNHKTY